MVTKFVSFMATVATGVRVVLRDNSPVTGKITSIMTHFPPGASALVQIIIRVGGRQVLPKEGYLALDSTTPQFLLTEPLELGEKIELDIANTDAVFSHTITVTITCEGEVGTEVPYGKFG